MTENSDEATLRALEATIVESAVDEVFVALPLDRSAALIKRIVRLCGEQGIIVRLHAEPFKLELTKTQVDIVDGVQVLTFGSGPHDDWQLIAKRIVDVLVSSVLLVILSPLFLLTSLLIKMDSRGPVLFKQERAGMNKRRFRVLKFRTMCQEAERLQGSLEQRTEADGPVFKVKDDPRVTGVGRVLRRCSIDELPQLINVLRGSMSLVGPRPLPMRDVMRISLAGHRRRFSVKPGMTCLWQVNGRSHRSFEEWIKMDLEYIDNWSMVQDLKILIRTVPAVLRGSGAY